MSLWTTLTLPCARTTSAPKADPASSTGRVRNIHNKSRQYISDTISYIPLAWRFFPVSCMSMMQDQTENVQARGWSCSIHSTGSYISCLLLLLWIVRSETVSCDCSNRPKHFRLKDADEINCHYVGCTTDRYCKYHCELWSYWRPIGEQNTRSVLKRTSKNMELLVVKVSVLHFSRAKSKVDLLMMVGYVTAL